MLKEIKQNRIYELDKLDTIKKEIEPPEIKDRETRDVLILSFSKWQSKCETEIKKMNKKSKLYRKDIRDAITIALSKGVSIDAACEFSGVHHSTYYN